MIKKRRFNTLAHWRKSFQARYRPKRQKRSVRQRRYFRFKTRYPSITGHSIIKRRPVVTKRPRICYTQTYNWKAGRYFTGLKIWDYRANERYRRSYDPNAINLAPHFTPFMQRLMSATSRIDSLRKFLVYKSMVRFHRAQLSSSHQLVISFRRHYVRLINLKGAMADSIARGQPKVHVFKKNKLQLINRRFIMGRGLLSSIVVSAVTKIVYKKQTQNFSKLFLRAAFAQQVLKLNYQIKRVLLTDVYRWASAVFNEFGVGALLSTSLVSATTVGNSLFPLAKKNVEGDWYGFWHKFRIFKWFFEYRRWRRSYQLSMWFRRLRSYRRIKKDSFYLQLFRLYFYYLGGINENAIVQAWRRFRRLDNRYQFTGLRFFQMLQMRLSNLLVFMGLATNSIAGMEVARLGLVRVNGYTKVNPYALVMAGDMLQFNLNIAFDYLTLFSDLYWIKVESQSNFIGFLQVLFSLLLFLVLRWPRRYELSETDSRLNSRMVGQILRLFPVRIADYRQVSRIKRSYERHQNIVKMMPYKYRKSRRHNNVPFLSFK